MQNMIYVFFLACLHTHTKEPTFLEVRVKVYDTSVSVSDVNEVHQYFIYALLKLDIETPLASIVLKGGLREINRRDSV